jgi:hypothetical protein
MTTTRFVSACLLGAAAAFTAPTRATAQDWIAEALDRPIELERFDDTPVRRIVERVAEETGVKVVFDAAAFRAVGTPDVAGKKLSFRRAGGVRAKTILEYLASQVDAVVNVRGNAVVFAPRAPTATALPPSLGQLVSAKHGTEQLRTAPFPELGQRVEGVDLASVLGFFSDKVDVYVWIDHGAFRRAGVTGDVGRKLVSFDVIRNKSSGQGLAIILEQLNATYRVVDQVVMIVPKPET